MAPAANRSLSSVRWPNKSGPCIRCRTRPSLWVSAGGSQSSPSYLPSLARVWDTLRCPRQVPFYDMHRSKEMSWTGGGGSLSASRAGPDPPWDTTLFPFPMRCWFAAFLFSDQRSINYPCKNVREFRSHRYHIAPRLGSVSHAHISNPQSTLLWCLSLSHSQRKLTIGSVCLQLQFGDSNIVSAVYFSARTRVGTQVGPKR